MVRSQSRYAALVAALVGLLGCNVAPPVVSEAYLPADTDDSLGPYIVTVKTSGVVDRVTLEWRTAASDDSPADEVPMQEVRPDTWEGAIPGATPGTEIRLSVRAQGRGGQTRFPSRGPHRFVILGAQLECDEARPCEAPTRCIDGRCVPECEVDEDCDESQVCQDGVCVELPGCADDAECAASEACVDGACVGRDPCDGVECPPESVCVDGECEDRPESCEALECPEGTLCNPETLECVRCITDKDCETNQTCVEGQCVEPDCGEDRNEPNDDTETATPIQNRLLASEAIVGLICAEDQDVFALGPLDAALGIQTSAPGVTVRLLSRDGAVFYEATLDANADEQVVVPVSSYLVVSTDSESELPFEIYLGDPAPMICEDDAFEENDSLDEAARLGGTGAYITATYCPDDVDWYQLRRQRNVQFTQVLVKSDTDDLEVFLEEEEGQSIGRENTPSARPGVLMEQWFNIRTTSVDALRRSPNFPDSPDLREVLSIAEIPVNERDRYGTRLSWFLVPQETGEYRFWISSDDNGELWFSPDADRENLALIAEVPVWTPSREWDRFEEQRSEPIRLEAGTVYAMEAFMKEEGGGDNLAIGWSTDDRIEVLTDDVCFVTSPYAKSDSEIALAYEGANRSIYLRVECSACEDAFEYVVSTRTSGEDCNDDELTPNHTIIEATPIGDEAVEYVGLVACSGDEDYFQITHRADETRAISVSFQNARGDIDLALWRAADLRPLRTEAGRQSGHELVLTPDDPPGVYYVSVSLFTAGQAQYTLNVERR